MPIYPLLRDRLLKVAARKRRLKSWYALAAVWVVAGITAVACAQSGTSGPVLVCVIGAVSAVAALLIILFQRCTVEADWRALAAEIEARHPQLEGRLLTAVQLQAHADNGFSYLQQRVFDEALQHAKTADWSDCVPIAHLRLAQTSQWLALVFLGFALLGLRVRPAHHSISAAQEPGVSITPGDTAVERGSTVVVLARFGVLLPPSVELVLGKTMDGKHIPLVKSLADPMFGTSIANVTTDFVYHVEYGSQKTRDFKVAVFEYPRLETADADIIYPEYTDQKPKHIPNTRRVSAVEGSKLSIGFHFNKPVSRAQLVPKKDGAPLALTIESNRPVAVLNEFALESSHIYDLQLVDAEGRTNKVPAQFVFDALTNRLPEIKLASPRGDQRPSPLEEIAFEGTVWDDFGLKAYGLGYAVAGDEPKWIELGRGVPGGEKRPFKYLLRLEDLGVQSDQLVSWFVWADDVAPDGQVRRTTGDLFFGEVRPFDEIYREAQAMQGQGQGGESGGQEGGQSGKLAELQKQIISATWKLQHETPKGSKRPAADTTEPQSSNAQPSKSTASEGSLRREAVQSSSSPKFNQLHLAGQIDPAAPARPVPGSTAALPNVSNPGAPHNYDDDAAVVRDAQAQALEQAQTALESQRDSRSTTLWRAATKEMERALARLRMATNSPSELKEALAAEQAAYQALLRLQEHEYQVARSRNQSRQGGGRSQQMQRQLEQMDLTQSENRYETQSEAQRPQPNQRREQLQVMNRLQELARRQQDLNDRLKELQTALQEARTEEERAEIQRRLKRLQEEEQQMLADVDATRQRMDQPENQSSMADQRRQLEQTRNEIQRAAEAAGQGAASQALAAGTRAQQQLQQARDQLRKESSSQFSEDLREMRAQARDLSREQERIRQQIEQEAQPDHKSLSDPNGSGQIGDQLAKQKERMTNLVERATQLSQQAEQPEPLLSKQLYDTVRKFGQDTTKDFKDLQEDLINRGLMTRRLYDELKESQEPDGAKLLELTTDLFNRHLLSQAGQTGERARTDIDSLKKGVEKAAESVLGDDAEALRLAQQELNQLTQELGREMSQANGGAGQTNTGAGALASSATQSRGRNGEGTNSVPGEAALQAQTGQPGDSANGGNQDRDPNAQPAQASSSPGSGSSQSQQSADAQGGRNPGAAPAGGRSERLAQQDGQGSAGNRGGAADRGGATERAAGGDWSNGGGANAGGGNLGNYLDRFLTDGRLRPYGPLTGEDFVAWAERLRDVEDMIDDPALRNELAQARERARLLRQAYKRDRQKPDWAVVQLQVMKPLIDARDRIADELARRDSREALVPVDRDPVPDKYSDLVRRYYENLGKQK